MGMMDILQQYAQRPTSTEQDFDEIAAQVPPDVLGDGISHALRSDQTPEFGNMVGQLFRNGNPGLRSGLLSQLIGSVGPALLGKLAGGLFGRDAAAAPSAGAAGSAAPSVRPEDLERLTPEQVEALAAEAQKRDPSVLDRVGSMAAQHPEAVKILGGAALAIALGQIATRMRR